MVPETKDNQNSGPRSKICGASQIYVASRPKPNDAWDAMQIGFLNFYSGVLNVRQDRADLIANNIANADTPGYKAVDVNFDDALSGQVSDPNSTPTAEYRTDVTVGLNGNDVSLDRERIEDAQNGEATEASATFLHQSTADLIAALRPNPGGD